MKSSTGAYYQGLDHIRALAVFLVFFWHFTGRTDLVPGSLSVLPAPFLSQGYTGVAIFMVLSGYLFAKLTEGRKLEYGPFLWNRFLRLTPLIGLVVLLHSAHWVFTGRGADLPQYFRDIFFGFVLPTLPNGGWSITAEFHFYLIFPFILYIERLKPFSSLAIIALAIVIRIVIGQIYLVRQVCGIHPTGRLSGVSISLLSVFCLQGMVNSRETNTFRP